MTDQYDAGVVSVIIITFNSGGVLGGLLDSLPAGLDGVPEHQLILVDNASTDGTVELVASRCPEAKIVQMGFNAGYAAAINSGVDASEGDGPVMILNPDIVLERGCIAALVRGLEYPRTGIVAPMLLDADGRPRSCLRRRPTILRTFGEAFLGGERSGRYDHFGELIVNPSMYDETRVAECAVGAALLCSRACLRDTGPWDESYFLYSEEGDFELRARDHGYELRYVPDARAIHYEGDANSSPELWALLSRNKVLHYQKRHGSSPSVVLFWLGQVLKESLRINRATNRAALAALMIPGRRTRIIEKLKGPRPLTSKNDAAPASLR